MIGRVKLKNFLSHENTEIEFGEGLTVFIGRNGAGKSSVIDAITYALYGRHTRGKRTHVRDGSGGGRVELELHMAGRKYSIVREFDGKGELRAASIREDGRLLVVGEKRDEERVSDTVSRILGMTYDRMVSSVIIQQGEIDAILKSDPKELKEFFDDMIGLRTFDVAYEKVRRVLEGFRERVRKATGKFPEDAKSVEQELESLRREVEGANEQEKVLVEELEKLNDEYRQINERVKRAEELIRLYHELESVLGELRATIRGEVNRSEERVARLEKALRLLSRKEEVETRVRRLKELESALQDLKGEKEGIRKQLEEIRKELNALPMGSSGAKSLDELRDEARRRAERLRDDSMELGKALAGGQINLALYELQDRVERDVESVVDLVSETYTSAMASRAAELMRREEDLQGQLNSVMQRITEAEKEIKGLRTFEGQDVESLRALMLSAEQEIKREGGEDGVKSLMVKLEGLRAIRAVLEKAKSPLDLDLEVLNGLDVLLGDEEVSRMTSRLKEGIAKLRDSEFRAETVNELEGLRAKMEQLNRAIGQKTSQLQVLRRNVEEAKGKIEQLEKVLDVLRKASEFYARIEKVRNVVYYRDGPVLKSLRTWIYSRISERARDYLDMFDAAVDNVRIEEKRTGRGSEVVFVCYYRGREVSWERLSGGEKVALALALRLAIGDVLGAQRLKFFVLDEPTVHLDSEKKERLREVLMRLSQKMPQVIVITHDEEIFEGSEARVLRFEKEGEITRVMEVRR